MNPIIIFAVGNLLSVWWEINGQDGFHFSGCSSVILYLDATTFMEDLLGMMVLGTNWKKLVFIGKRDKLILGSELLNYQSIFDVCLLKIKV